MEAKFNFKLETRNLVSAAHAMPNDLSRVCLHGVHICRNGTLGAIVATDGHMLIKIECDIPEEIKFTLPYKAVSMLCELYRRQGKKQKAFSKFEVRLNEGQTEYEVELDQVVVKGNTVDVAFPDWKRVVPNSELALGLNRLLSVNANLLVELQSSVRVLFPDRKLAPIAMAISGETDPIRLECSYVPQWQAVLMPMRY